MSVQSIIQKNLDTGPQNPSDVHNFQNDLNQRHAILQKATSGRPNKVRRWLQKRQVKRARATWGDEGVGRHPQTGEIVYKTCATARNGTEWESKGTIKKADGYLRTIYDLIDLNYNLVPSAKGAGLSKADDPILTSTTGVHNDIFGSDVFHTLNTEQNLVGILETRPWTKSGERIIDSFAATQSGGSLGEGGVTENATLSDTIRPGFDTFSTEPKTILHTFDVSQVEQLLAATDDDAISDDPFALLRQWFGEGLPEQQGREGGGEHPKHINVQLGSDTARDETAGSTFEFAITPIDRAISNSAESTILATGSDNDIYGFDRSAGEFESNVVENGGTNTTFVLDMMEEAMRLVKENSDKNPQKYPEGYVWVTGHDTYDRIEDEFGPKERIDTMRVAATIEGIQTNPGNDVGVSVATYKDIPIIESNDVTQDGISRIYLIDTETLWIKSLLPTQFYSTGTEVGDGPFPLGRLGNEGAFVTIQELTLKNPAPHCKIRDLK